MSLMFQETSAESFEESLMAGGYGRYVRPRFDHAPIAILCSVLVVLVVVWPHRHHAEKYATYIYCSRSLYWSCRFVVPPMLTIS